MNKIYEHLNLVSSTSSIAMRFFEGKNQNELDRFVYVGIKKISKISLAFLRLYEQVDESENLEFSLGILSRSIMMDMILVMGLQKISAQHDGSNHDEIKSEIKKYCLKVISDGTEHLINQIKETENFSEDDKNKISLKLASTFPAVFNFLSNVTRREPEFKKDSLANVYKESKHLNQEINKTIYHLYDFYSKYDHLSHWTSEFDKIPFEIRKGKLDLSILYMGYHLKNLLAIAYDFADGYTSLLPLIQSIEKSEKEKFDNEDTEVL
jgi:hypothetical protein